MVCYYFAVCSFFLFVLIVIANWFLVVLYCYLTLIKAKELQQTRIYDKHSTVNMTKETSSPEYQRKVTKENNLKQIALSQGSKKIIVRVAAWRWYLPVILFEVAILWNRLELLKFNKSITLIKWSTFNEMYYNLKVQGYSYLIWFKVKRFIIYTCAKWRSWKEKNCL